jgi:ribosomal protein S18 acetylase RimI-like enzyme
MSFIARNEDRIVGAILAGHDDRRGYIHHLAVDPVWRGKGVGTYLVSASIDALRREGIKKAHLFVFKENESAQKFWENLGWEIREDILIMSRNF